METVYFKGTPCHTYGQIPAVGTPAPGFNLAGKGLDEVRLSDYKGKRVVLNVFPSLDTLSARLRFENSTRRLPVSKIPQWYVFRWIFPSLWGRFCSAEGIENVTVASAFRSPVFSQEYGLQIVDGPLAGLLARAVIVLDENHKVIYSDLVEEITNEPDYKGAISVLK